MEQRWLFKGAAAASVSVRMLYGGARIFLLILFLAAGAYSHADKIRQSRFLFHFGYSKFRIFRANACVTFLELLVPDLLAAGPVYSGFPLDFSVFPGAISIRRRGLHRSASPASAGSCFVLYCFFALSLCSLRIKDKLPFPRFCRRAARAFKRHGKGPSFYSLISGLCRLLTK